MVSLVMTLMVSPKNIIVFGIIFLFICTFTIGLPRLEYLGLQSFPNIRSARVPRIFIIGGSFLFLLCLFMQEYLMNLLQMGISLMACKGEIFTYRFLTSSRIMLFGWSGYLASSL